MVNLTQIIHHGRRYWQQSVPPLDRHGTIVLPQNRLRGVRSNSPPCGRTLIGIDVAAGVCERMKTI
jgi:hypothetical protein